MQEITTPVTLRQLQPSEGMCIHKIDTDEYYYDFENETALSPYIGKNESLDNYEEVPIKDVPRPNPPETNEVAETSETPQEESEEDNISE